MKYSKDKKLFVKIAACLLGALMSIIATPFLRQEFVTALADSAMVDTNVAYFEGMAPNMSDFEIRKKEGALDCLIRDYLKTV